VGTLLVQLLHTYLYGEYNFERAVGYGACVTSVYVKNLKKAQAAGM